MLLLSLKLLLSLVLFLFFTRPIFAQLDYDQIENPYVYQITAGVPPHPVEQLGEVYFTKEFNFPYSQGPVFYSTTTNWDPTAMTLATNIMNITVLRPDGTTKSLELIYHNNCVADSQQLPLNLDYLFKKGVNKVKISFTNICGGNRFSTPLYFVTAEGELGPTPFLDLPWNYQALDMTFTEAANSMSSFFDHEYPFLSRNLSEPEKLVNYRGVKNTWFYSSHDGYDYGSLAKTKMGTPQLAAAAGEASYISPNSCPDCGNAIYIDHKNGFQTRYYHLQPEGLIVDREGTKVSVAKGQKIGEVGFSGNVQPKGEAGSHIHFMVVQDKNNDGNFEDNIPDGLVDPFGWQSKESDPWENYSFFYKGQQRTGNKSYYLFTNKLDGLDSTLTSNAAVFNIGKNKLEFPAGSTNENLSLIATTEPNFKNDLLNSLGSVLNVIAKNPAGNPVTTFLTDFILTIDFSQFDLSRYNLDTLSIYSSHDGINWTKEDTEVDMVNKSAKTSLNHLTYFALMAVRKDTAAPTTNPILSGQRGIGNNFRSDVSLTLNTVDNEGGLGVEFTAWGYENQPWQTYTSPLSFSTEGDYKIFFYSQDKDDNIEEIKSTEFSIDKTPPEAKIEVDKINWDLKVLPLASDSSILKTTLPKSKAVYKITDPAGNSLTLDTYDLNTKYIDLFKIYSLTYNSNPKITLPDNLMDLNYIFYTPKTREEIKVVNQNFALKDKAVFLIVADAIKNKTILNILENGKTRKEEYPSLKFLKLQTNQGKLEYSY